MRAASNLLEAEGARLQVRSAPNSPAEALSFIDSFVYGEIKPTPTQKRDEILGLLELLETERPRTVLELGTFHGGTLFLFSRVAVEDAVLVTVDLPAGLFGGGYPRSWARFLRGFARGAQKIHLVRGSTRSTRTRERVESIFGGLQKVDFLFIDADHRYEGVRADYEEYAPLVRDGGIIAFHDIVPGDESAVGEVPRFWAELKMVEPDAIELVEDWGQGGYGIGVIRRKAR
jgi:predicted O-methyltransferase YrrM